MLEKDPIAKALADKLSKRMSCQILQDVDDKLKKVQELMEKKGLEWKEVAYLGETGAPRFSQLHQPNAMICKNMVHLRNDGVANTGLKDSTSILTTNTKTYYFYHVIFH